MCVCAHAYVYVYAYVSVGVRMWVYSMYMYAYAYANTTFMCIVMCVWAYAEKMHVGFMSSLLYLCSDLSTYMYTVYKSES